MGVSAKTLHRLLYLAEKGNLLPRGAMLELGSQNLYAIGSQTEFLGKFIARLRKAAALEELILTPAALEALGNGGKMSRLMSLCGFDYQALDIFSDDKVVLFDLNLHDLPADLMGKFDIVTNFGTTEHVFDQVRAFRTMHDATKAGGVMYHDLPMGGYIDHGYFCYTPMFFRHVAAANSYDILFELYSASEPVNPVPVEMVGAFADTHFRDQGIEFAFKKVSYEPFRMPLDIGTSLGLDTSVWGADVPYHIVKKESHGQADASSTWMGNEDGASVVRLSHELARLRQELSNVRDEFHSFKSYFRFGMPLARLIRRRSQ